MGCILHPFFYILTRGDNLKKKYLDVGKIVGTHGIKGELRVQPWCDSPEFLCDFKKLYFDEGEKEVKVLKSRVNKNVVIIKIDGTDTIEKANLLRGKVLYIDRKDAKIDDGSYFIQDIIGMKVIDNDNGNIYGIVTDVLKTGANDVYQVTDDKGKNYLVPVINDVIINIDLEEDRIYISPIEGIFENED